MKILYLHNAEYTSTMANLIQVKAMCKAMSDAKMDVTLSLQGSNKNKFPTGKYPYNIDIRKPLVNNKKI
ncbi:MAG: glycosyltransferase family 1 protein, partial [Bacteroidota bacterium]